MERKSSAVIVTVTQVVDGVVTNETKTVEGCTGWREVNYKAGKFLGGIMGAAQGMVDMALAEPPDAVKPWDK